MLKSATNLALRIKRRREDLGLTQQDIANLVGVHVVNVSRWETGTRNPVGVNLKKLADALKVTRSWLMEDAPPADDTLADAPSDQAKPQEPQPGEELFIVRFTNAGIQTVGKIHWGAVVACLLLAIKAI